MFIFTNCLVKHAQHRFLLKSETFSKDYSYKRNLNGAVYKLLGRNAFVYWQQSCTQRTAEYY
jgi:hypothetical protein